MGQRMGIIVTNLRKRTLRECLRRVGDEVGTGFFVRCGGEIRPKKEIKPL